MKQLRVGLVGLGFGLRCMRGLMRTASGAALLDIRAVCDVRPRRLQEAARAFQARACGDVEELLSDPEIEAVVLFTGPAGRAELIRRIIRAGKHVMTTKPFELDAAEALCVLREAERLGRVVHMNSPSPHLRDHLRQITAWQRSYDLGRPVAAQFQTCCAYRESADGTWYDDADLCPVAPIFRLGIYAINDVLHFLPDPEEVQVMHSRICTGRPTPDHAQLGIRFRGGELATILASFCIDTGLPYPDRLTLSFERGCVYRNATPAAAATKAELQLEARPRRATGVRRAHVPRSAVQRAYVVSMGNVLPGRARRSHRADGLARAGRRRDPRDRSDGAVRTVRPRRTRP
jgi:predicted dehydrogenase